MKPVVSCIDSPRYFLVKTFMDILIQALPQPSSFIKNSFEVRSKIQNLVIPDNYVMLSLDVSSLFTNVSLPLVLKGIEKRWHHICKWTKILLQEFKDGIELLMNSTYFQFDNKYYKQIYVSPMGSPISPIT